MNIPTTEENHIAEIIAVAEGRMPKKDYAAILKIDPTRISARMEGDYQRAIKVLQAEKSDLQADAIEAQEKISELQEKVSDLKAHVNNLQVNHKSVLEDASRNIEQIKSLQAANNELQLAINAIEEHNRLLQVQLKEAQAVVERFTSRPQIIQFFGSSSTRAFLAVLLAFFEIAGTIHLLEPKGLAMAIPVGIAMGFSLLAFASSENDFGKWFCIVFSFAVGLIYFEPWNTGLPQDWLFAFVPPTVNATIINSFSKK